MNVLFLDVDGVLNSEKFPALDGNLMNIAIEHLHALELIWGEISCKIVISSTWRKHADRTILLMQELGKIDAAKCVIGTTPVLDKKLEAIWTATYRGNEIQAWLDDHPEVETFVILDDEDDMVHLKPKLVQTDYKDGLTVEKANEVIAKFKEQGAT